MNKKKGFVVGIACVFFALLVGVVLIFGDAKEIATEFHFTEEVSVENGVANKEDAAIPFTVEKDGSYFIHTQWDQSSSGMISALAIYNPENEIVFCVTGESVSAESVELELESGEYVAHYYYFTNQEDLNALLAKTDAESYDDAPYSYEESGTFNATYQFELWKANGRNHWLHLGVFVGVVIGLLLVVIILTVTKTDGDIEPKYDERQMLERGKGFKLAFFVEMIYTAFLILMYIMEIKVPVATEVLLFFGIVLSVFVYAIYCIRKEAYISLNENAKKINIAFLLIGIANLLIGVSHCFSGGMIQDGVLTFRSLNLICGIFMMIMSIVIGTSQMGKKDEEE